MRAARFLGRVVQNRRGGVPRPSYCTYLVTYRCNARCGMCDSWRMKPGTEMTLSDVDTVFGKLGRLDAVRLTGGEPFLRDDLLDIAETVMRQSRPLALHITTNGSLPETVESFARAFSAPRRLRFMVSLDGMHDEHDRNRGPRATFDLAFDTVHRLHRLRGSGVRVSINHTVVSEQSLEDHERIQAVAPPGVDVQSVLAYAESAMYAIKLRGKKASHLIVPRGYPLHPALRNADSLGFVDRQLARVDQMGDPLLSLGKRYYLEGLRGRLAGGDQTEWLSPPCVALRSHVRLLPDGRVPVCQFNTETVGSLVDSSLGELWSAPETTEARQWVDACPGCWAECEVMPSAVYSGDIVRHQLVRLRRRGEQWLAPARTA